MSDGAESESPLVTHRVELALAPDAYKTFKRDECVKVG
jgi:threonine dehydrogenase-like Zn-dependent dehydrogenase